MPIAIKKQLKQMVRSLSQKNYYSAKLFYHLQLKREIAGQEQLLFVYQMGKVGSSTVVRSLMANNLRAYNLHTFNPAYLNRDQKIYKEEFDAGKHNAKTLWDELLFLRELGRNFKGKPVKIISLVRDPVARNFSLFFQWPNMIMEPSGGDFHVRSPSFHYDKVLSSKGIEAELAKLFMTQFKLHDRPLVWFDKEMKDNFNIDVYSNDFPREKGYDFYRHGNTEVMVIKLEKLNTVARKAFKEFLNIESFELIAANIGREKNTSNLYRRYLDAVKLPAEYLDRLYSSKFATHFYSKDEIDSFRKRWSRSS